MLKIQFFSDYYPKSIGKRHQIAGVHYWYSRVLTRSWGLRS